MSIMHIATLVFEALLGVFTVYSAYGLFTGTPPNVAKIREALRFPRWYWMLAGVVATIGAVGLFTGLVSSQAGALAALWMIAYFIVAALTHLVRRDFANMGPPLVFLALFVGLTALRWGAVTSLLGFH